MLPGRRSNLSKKENETCNKVLMGVWVWNLVADFAGRKEVEGV